ncbi:SusC/RagA family TonB-linked outer membrane protein [Dysgonomonas macrotermitis]|uniref:Iron complex outermembrane recepter protein n=1 Tax=Dysgonomonas macrotermitis TaxID=1346286 RepID=A0A1M4WRS4_9BACT|nr:TonB-dependent receptor [Dysgonomonas macrotermitis]SHE83857.1 iron complex outermembrane recepter protein [Dysgonomonas macrotermitis]
MKEKVKKSCATLFLFFMMGILSVSTMYAQGGSSNVVNGIVLDSNGESIIGASVLVKGSATGTVTDLDGKFQLNAPANATLVISYIGYKAQEVAVAGQKNITIRLADDSELLSEVVVIGYGTVKKDDATGSVVAIKIDEKNKGLATSPQDLLGGKIAGVNVTSSGGRPGDGSTIRIRGGSSLSAKNDPLVIVDGVIMSNDLPGSSNFLSTVNPADIETFTVLKDASATAIYGSRASNGVILITTKKGTSGALKFSYNGNMSISTKRNSVDVMTGDEYRAYVADRFAYDSRKETVLGMLGTANTDWQDEIFKTALGTDHNLSVYGSVGKSVPFRASVGYTKQDGILETSSMDRVTGSLSLSPSLFDDHLKLNINAKGMYSKSRFADTGAVGSAVAFDPTQSVMDESSMWGGYFSWRDGDGLSSLATKNPVAILKMRNNRANVRNFIGNFQADYKLHFFPDLRFNLNLGIDVASTNGAEVKDPFNPTSFSLNDEQSGFRKNFENLKNNQLFEFYTQYLKDVESLKSKFDVMAGYSWQRYKKTSDEGQWYISKEDRKTSIGEVTPGRDYFDYKEYYLLSFFGRLNYTFNEKYLFTFTIRDDGSSRFASGNRWGIFPATAVAWKMKDEPFLKDVSVVSDAKLRLGWGKTGQQDLGDDRYYPSTPSYSTGAGKAYYPMGLNSDGSVNWVNVMRPSGYNADLKWETTATWNAGLDYGFLNNRINGSLDFYWRKTSDLLNLVAPVVAGTSAAEILPQNIGELTNRGVEFSINARPIVSRDFEWLVGFNVAYNKSKITKLTNAVEEDYVGDKLGSTGGDGGKEVQIYMTGYAPKTFYVYEQVYDDNGKPIEGVYVDRNGDGVVDEGDLYYYKKPAADVTMGFNSKWTYKNWDFGFNGRVSLGNYVYNSTEANSANLSLESLYSNSAFMSNKPTSALDTDYRSRQLLSDYYVQNASFLKIDNITLGYTFNNLKFAKLSSSSSARIFTTVQNAIVITKYKGLDPEVFDGIDYDLYPRPLVFMFGVNLNF